MGDVSKDVCLLWRVLRQICGEHEGKYCSSCPLIGIECMIEFCENKKDLDKLIAAVQKWHDDHQTFERRR